jgi:hypothetical protein
MISYAITVCNEEIEFKQLINHLKAHIDTEDEIVVLCDKNNTLDSIEQFALETNLKFYKDSFGGDFADWKNKLNSYCSGSYIFQIDADEIPNKFLLINLKSIIKSNDAMELIWVPRENYVFGITEQHLNKWHWNLDEHNRINFPDYQGRIYKNQINIYWAGKVHETIKCSGQVGFLPATSEMSILHKKTIQKQEKQNNLYEELI